MFKLIESEIPGCFEIEPRVFNDKRGTFVKIFNSELFSELNLETDFREEYYSISKQNVVRGMHFQKPPMDHVKIVYCTFGDVIDVVVDLRSGSPTYGKCAKFELSSTKKNYVYIPKGLAHGFCVLSKEATLVYKVSTVYSSEHDAGILWSSLPIEWPVNNPIISERDTNFVELESFESPFIYDEE